MKRATKKFSVQDKGADQVLEAYKKRLNEAKEDIEALPTKDYVDALIKGGTANAFHKVIADDEAYSWFPGKDQGIIIFASRYSFIQNASAVVVFKCPTATGVTIIAQPSTNVEATTGVLAGTTGTDAKFTISAHTDSKVYLENRTGASIDIDVWVLTI